jgi:peptidoglycan/xylan/chitin deacetylase (PgdA/CDA1 family)
VSALKALAKRSVVRAVARAAPVTWHWREPGSLVVLMYHRVLPKDSPLRRSEQPGMYVAPETLDLHLGELGRRFELVHLDDWLRRAKRGESLPRIACAITFDDGWRDNYEFALPVLLKHAAPATIFLVSSYVGSTQRFWPNRLMDLVRAEFACPGSVSFPAKLSALVEPALAQGRTRGDLDNEAIDPIVQLALKLPEDEIRALVETADGPGETEPPGRETLDRQEIAAMASTGRVRFGSHSATHFRLDAGASDEVLAREIDQSRTALQEICAQPIELFCYPNGVTCAAAVTRTSQQYLGAVSTVRGWYRPGANPYLIPRIAVHDDISADRDGFLACLSGWL